MNVCAIQYAQRPEFTKVPLNGYIGISSFNFVGLNVMHRFLNDIASKMANLTKNGCVEYGERSIHTLNNL